MSNNIKALRIEGPDIPPSVVNGLDGSAEFKDQHLQEERARATYGLLVRSVPETGEKTDGNTLVGAISEEIMIPNAMRRARVGQRMKPITTFTLKHTLELTFYGKQPAETIWWMVQHGLDPRRALDRQTYRFEFGADVRVLPSRSKTQGVMIFGRKEEKHQILNCSIVNDPYEDSVDAHRMNDEPVFTLRLEKPTGFNPNAQVAGSRGRTGGGSPGKSPGLGSSG